MEKLEWWGYLMVKNFEDMYRPNRLYTILACDGQTDKQTYEQMDEHLATAQSALCIRVAR